jgi:hypothetical protein
MEEQYQDILNGFVILLLIINTMAISTLLSEKSQYSSSNPGITTTESGSSSPDTNDMNLSANSPAITATSPVKTKISTLPAKPVPVQTLVPARKDYVNIFYMQNKELNTEMPPVYLNLLNPPLIIDFSVNPLNVTDLIPYDYKILSTEHHDIINVSHAYENAEFRITVTDNDTGMIVAQNGYGKDYGLQSPQTMKVMQRGNYTIGISGMYVNTTISMEVPKEGN